MVEIRLVSKLRRDTMESMLIALLLLWIGYVFGKHYLTSLAAKMLMKVEKAELSKVDEGFS